jgi:hypothetical protein
VSFYRLYFRDSDGHFSGMREIEARDDAQAIGRIDRMFRGDRRELWRNEILLGRWMAEQDDCCRTRPKVAPSFSKP